MKKPGKLGVSVALVLIFLFSLATSSLALGGPTITTLIPGENGTSTTANFTISFTVTDSDSPIKNSGYFIKMGNNTLSARLDYPGHWEDNPATDSYDWVIDTYNQATISAPVSGAKDGDYNVQVQATDNAGNTVNKSWNITVAVKPTFANPTPANGTATTNNTGFSVKVTDNSAVDPQKISATLDNNPVATTYNPTTGIVAYTSTIPDGTHTAVVTASDTAGNTSSQTWSFTVQTTGPTLSFSKHDQTFNSALPALSVDVNSIVNLNSSVTVQIDGAQVPATFTYLGHTESNWDEDYYVVDSYKQGTITCGPSAQLGDGTHKLTVTAKDQLGNSTTTTWNFGISQPPAFSGLSPSDGSVVTVKPVIKATIKDNGSVNQDSVALSIDDTKVTPSVVKNTDGSVSVTYNADNLNNDATHTVKLTAADAAGNEASTSWKFFATAIGQVTGFTGQTPVDKSVVSTAKPAISVHFSNLNKAYDTANISLTIDGGTPVQTTLTGKDTEFLISYTPQSLGDGQHTINVSIPSLTGAAPITTSWNFTVEASPVITKTGPSSNVTTNTPVLEAYASDNSAVASGKFTIDGQTLDAALDPNFNRLSVKVPTALTDGSHAVTLTVLDQAGNSATNTWNFTVDTNLGPTNPDMPVASNTTCWSCHTKEYNLHHVAPTQCLQCHTPNFTSISTNATIFRDCIGCHYNNAYITGRHSWDRTWVWSNLPNDRHPVNDEHLSATTECTQCHSRILTQEHNRAESKDKNGNPITCDTCHGQTYLASVSSDEAAKVKTAIANKDSSCEACHGQTNHASVHDSQFDSKCTGSGCHNSNIETEHLNNVTTSGKGITCNTCHESTNSKVSSAIRNGQISCNACHTAAHNVALTSTLPTDIPKFDGLSFSQPIEASIFAGDLGLPSDFAANYKSGFVVISNRGSVDPAKVWDYYKNALTGKGWTLNSADPGTTPTYFAVEFKKDGRLLTVRCYNTVFGDNSGGQASGYRVDIWYN